MIGYYVHHHGTGHLARARVAAARLDEPVVALSSLPAPAVHPFAEWVALPGDPAVAGAREPDADGALHWAPLSSTGYRDRMAALAAWVASARPRLVVVDVSVEVAALVRLLGVPVVVVAMPGRRDDAAHRLGYGVASLIVAPWPRDVLDPAHLAPFARKVVHTGAWSRYDGRSPAPSPRAGRVLVLAGAGGGGPGHAELAELARATATDVRGFGGRDLPWTDDLWAPLGEASIVVTHAGGGCLAEVAAARRPAVVIPQARPFAEQASTAGALRDAGLAVVCETWPAAEEWPDVLRRAGALDGEHWRRWNDGAGADRFARALAAVPGAP